MDVIGVGITENADRQKLEKIASVSVVEEANGEGEDATQEGVTAGSVTDGAGDTGGSGAGKKSVKRPRIIIPQSGEALSKSFEKAVVEKVVEGK